MSTERAADGALLEVDHLAVTFYTTGGAVRAVRDASFHINRGEVLGLVGESGCGKSTVSFAIMGYLPGTSRVDGTIRFEGRDISKLSSRELRQIRGDRIGMVYQDPVTSLNPTMRVGAQIEEVLRTHLGMGREAARRRTVELFSDVGLPDPGRVGRRYPHQLSGGMQQRVVIAMALACEPDLLIMDEPTTGLDVTTEATILDLIVDLKDRVNAGILFVSHNLGVIARIADRVAVMYAGESVEVAPVRELYASPRHPYTAGLMSCVPKPPTEKGTVTTLTSIPGSVFPAESETPNACLFADRCPMATDKCGMEAPQVEAVGDNGHLSRCFYSADVALGMWGEVEERITGPAVSEEEPLLAVRGLRNFYGGRRKKYIFFGPKAPPVRAVVDLDLDVGRGRTLGIVGESGSGKTTVARSISGLVRATGGEMKLNGEDLPRRLTRRTDEQRGAIRMVFQNPTSSLNPKLQVGHLIIRSLRKFAGLGRRQSRERARELMSAVGLAPEYLERKPSELSGGQQQRVALAGAFAAAPDLVVADEAVSALDVSVQAQVLELLSSHQEEEGTSYVFISHDLGVVRYLSDDIVVLYAGHVAESGPAEAVLSPPYHPYTEALLSAAPVPDPRRRPTAIRLAGNVPTMREAFEGCFFASRCPRKIGDICDEEPPPRQSVPGSGSHTIACHIPIDELRELDELEVQRSRSA